MTRVRYEVEETRVGQKQNYDKLTLEVWTDGTITPEMAIVEAAKILRKHLIRLLGTPLRCFDTCSCRGHSSSSEGVLDLEKLEPTSVDEPISVLDLSTRAKNCCDELGITTVGELAASSKEKLASSHFAGDGTIDEMEKALGKKGLSVLANNRQECIPEFCLGIFQRSNRRKVEQCVIVARVECLVEVHVSPAGYASKSGCILVLTEREFEPGRARCAKVPGRIVTTVAKAKEVRPWSNDASRLQSEGCWRSKQRTHLHRLRKRYVGMEEVAAERAMAKVGSGYARQRSLLDVGY